MKKIKILPICLSFLILIYILFVMLVNLSSFPGLHGDEAWFGLNAREILHHGTRSLHGLNTYTSSFYIWLISLTFTVLIEYCPHCRDFPKYFKIIETNH